MPIKPAKLTVAALNVKYLFEFPSDGSTHPSGVEGKVLATLMEALRWDYNLTTPPDLQTGIPTENGSWTGMIGMVKRGEADLGITSMVHTHIRNEAVDFSFPYMHTGLNFATDLPTIVPRAYAYVYPFDRITWIMLGVMVLAMPLAIGFLFRTKDHSKLWLTMFGSILGKSVNQRGSRLPEELFLMFWCLGGLIISFSYSAVIFSFLSVPLFDDPPNDFYELSDAVEKGQYKVYIIKASVFTQTLSRSKEPHISLIYNAIIKNQWFIDRSAVFRPESFGKNVARVSSTFHFKLFFGEPPFNTKHVATGFLHSYCGLIIRKELRHLKDAIDMTLLRILEAGLFDKFVEDHIFRMWLKSTFVSKDVIHPLSLDEIYGAIVILCLGWFLSGVVFVFEIMYNRVRVSKYNHF